jgi:hypothetical protein
VGNPNHSSLRGLGYFYISYQVQTDKWKRVSPKNVFSDFGYNQLLVYGLVDNTLEQAFSKVETPLPKTFEALEEALTNFQQYCLQPFLKIFAGIVLLLSAYLFLQRQQFPPILLSN